MMTRIKICGITNPQDAELAINAGADWLGLIFVPGTPRYVRLQDAHEIVNAVRGKAQVIGVFQNSRPTDIREYIQRLGLDAVQLHGDEPPEECALFEVPVIKTFLTDNTLTRDAVAPYLGADSGVSYLLIDKPKGEAPPADIPCFLFDEGFPTPVILAGKLTPDNVTEILKHYHPYGVDVASGVEAEPGRKDPAKLTTFCDIVRNFTDSGGHGVCNP